MPQFDLFQEIILDHFKKPRNRGELTPATRTLEATLPSCGDHLFLDLLIEGDRLVDVKFRGSGCSISMASASMMTAAVKGKPLGEALKLIESFRKMMRGEPLPAGLGELQALQGVAKLPVRVKCATLAWSTLEQAIQEEKTEREDEQHGH